MYPCLYMDMYVSIDVSVYTDEEYEGVFGDCGCEREPHPEAAVSLRKMVTFVTWPSSSTEFLVYKIFCNDIFIRTRSRAFEGRSKAR